MHRATHELIKVSRQIMTGKLFNEQRNQIERGKTWRALDGKVAKGVNNEKEGEMGSQIWLCSGVLCQKLVTGGSTEFANSASWKIKMVSQRVLWLFFLAQNQVLLCSLCRPGGTGPEWIKLSNKLANDSPVPIKKKKNSYQMTGKCWARSGQFVDLARFCSC